MNKITFVVVSLATAVAFAQAPAKDAKAPAAAKDAKAPAAGAVAPAKAPADKAPAADSKAPAKMEMPKPPAEVADMGKKMAGTWNCTGEMMDMADPTKMNPMKGKIVWKLDADKAWIVGNLTEGKMKLTLMETYDAASKKWYRIGTDSAGGSETAWSDGGAKAVWTGEGRGMNMPAWKTRTTEEMVSDKEIKLTGEMSSDGGKKWMTAWSSDCKK
ncbi:MAG TPA: hypothetical protein VGM90_27115 [Kofleriaceae bacterium]|jgi:hypothetical protein